MTEQLSTADDVRDLYDIPEENMQKFRDAVAKINKRAEKLIGDPQAINLVVYSFEPRICDDGRERRFYNVMIDCVIPKVAGDWVFVARLDHSNDTGNIVRKVPNTGIELPEAYRTAQPNCDHCKLRRLRRDTFVMHNRQTGEFIQLGATCLNDYFGHDVFRIAQMAELLGYAAELAGGYGRYEFGLIDRRCIVTEDYLAHAAVEVRQFGWVSASAARENDSLISTRERTDNNYFQKVREYYVEPTDEDRALAAEALDWARSMRDKPNLTDYEYNVLVVAESPVIEWRSLGLAASIVGVYFRKKNPLPQKRAAIELGDLSRVIALFDNVNGSKLKHPKIVLGLPGIDAPIKLSVAGPNSKAPGAINVTKQGAYFQEEGAWFGRINRDGTYYPARHAPQGIEDGLRMFAADPVKVATEHGHKTGNCCFCNKPLTDARSTEVGYGSTCAKNWNLPWGKKVAEAA